jgi:hypothetical protein
MKTLTITPPDARIGLFREQLIRNRGHWWDGVAHRRHGVYPSDGPSSLLEDRALVRNSGPSAPSGNIHSPHDRGVQREREREWTNIVEAATVRVAYVDRVDAYRSALEAAHEQLDELELGFEPDMPNELRKIIDVIGEPPCRCTPPLTIPELEVGA